jgi:HEAT repeat protein
MSAMPSLLKAAGESDPKIRSAAMLRLGELGGPGELPALLDMLQRSNESQDLDAIETAVARILSRLEHPESNADRLTAMLTQASPAQKIAVLRILGSLGGADALKAVRAAVDDSNADVQAAAIRVLGAWKTADAVPELLGVAVENDHSRRKILALRACLGWAGRAVLPADQRLAICRQGAPLAERIEERRLLLSALGNVDSPEALTLIVPYLADTETRGEAAAAAVSVAERVLKLPDAAKLANGLVEPLQKVTQASVPQPLAQRAKAALQQAQRKMATK